MRSKGDSSVSTSTIAIVVTLLLAIVYADYTIVSRLDSIEAKNDVRATEVSGRLKVIEGFLREKHPEFSNFARRESLLRLKQDVAQALSLPAAQTTVGTFERFDPKTRLISLQGKERQTESYQLSPETEVWVYIPKLRRVRRLSVPSDLLVTKIANLPVGTAVIVHTGGPSNQQVLGIVLPAEGPR
jgi:hypothetical protein